MFCAKDQRDVAFCTCPDIDERLRNVSGPEGGVVSVWCKICDKHKDRCKCVTPVLALRQDGVARAVPVENEVHIPTDRPVFPTEIQPVFDPSREIRGMTKVVTESGSEYVFRSENGRTYLTKYTPSGSSRVSAEQAEGAVLFSEYPIEPGYPLALRLEGGGWMRSTRIKDVDLHYEEE